MLKEPWDIAFGIADWFRNKDEGERYAKFSTDLGKVSSPEEAVNLRRNLSGYEFVNPNVVAKASDDINQWLDKYSTANKFSVEQAEKELVGKNLQEAALLYPAWREEVGQYAPKSQFYSDWQGRIDPRALALEGYQKGFRELDGGITEGENRGITAAREGQKLTGEAALNKYISDTPVDNTLEGHNAYFEGMRRIPNVDPRLIESYQKDFVGRNAGVASGNTFSTTTQVGPERGSSTVGLDIYGRPIEGTKSSANDNPENRAIQREQMSQKKKELGKPNIYSVEYDDGTIEQFNANVPSHSARINEIIENKEGIISKGDNPESVSEITYDKEGNESRKTKKLRKPLKNRKITLPNTPQVQTAKAAGYSDAEIEAYLKQQRK